MRKGKEGKSQGDMEEKEPQGETWDIIGWCYLSGSSWEILHKVSSTKVYVGGVTGIGSLEVVSSCLYNASIKVCWLLKYVPICNRKKYHNLEKLQNFIHILLRTIPFAD